MASEIDSSELASLLHRLAGRQALVVRDHLPSDVREAVEAKGELKAYRRLLAYVEYYEQNGEWPSKQDDDQMAAYEDVSRAMQDADQTVEGVDEAPEIGVQ